MEQKSWCKCSQADKWAEGWKTGPPTSHLFTDKSGVIKEKNTSVSL